jgi:Sec7-like guanine-nucleotide exchange factor
MLLSVIPLEVVQCIFDHLVYDSLLSCSRVSVRWHSIIVLNCVLAARVDMRKAINIFNENAELGIEFITQSISMIYNDPCDIAHFLTHPLLNKQQVGRFLGHKKHKEVLDAVLRAHDYTALHLDEALRKCFCSFQPIMTTSGMKHILKAFSRRFCVCNPHYFCCETEEEAAETGYLLCFAMLMLNTDAHNSMVTNKMTRQQFVAYIFSSLNLKVNINYLEGLYNRVVSQEIKPEPSENPVTKAVRSAFRWASVRGPK